mgnify:CR=1 FL=1
MDATVQNIKSYMTHDLINVVNDLWNFISPKVQRVVEQSLKNTAQTPESFQSPTAQKNSVVLFCSIWSYNRYRRFSDKSVHLSAIGIQIQTGDNEFFTHHFKVVELCSHHRKGGGIFHTFRCQVHLIDKRHRISIRNSLEQGSHFHRAAIPLAFHACTVITMFLLAANGVDDSLRSVETVGALEPSFIIRSPSAPPVINTLSAVARIFLHYQKRILILRSDTIAQPAPERCSSRVWVLPTSILQSKISRCIYVCIACERYEASQCDFQIWKSFCNQDRQLSSSTWSGRLFFCTKIFAFATAASRAHRYHFAIFESDFLNPNSKTLVGLRPNPIFSAKLRWLCILSSKGIMTHKGLVPSSPLSFCQSFHRLFLQPAESGVFSNLFVDTARFLW